ncbi:MAG: hypothetical protein JWO81_2677 [Alphaproteobacteria bacterium]|nr:hypothetical protein [Alphaproteobacteria bacterium]
MTEPEEQVRAAFVTQAGWCDRLGAPFTALLCRLLGDRLGRSTELGRQVLRWPGNGDPFVDALALRLCGGLHALVRRGDAPSLAQFYPPSDMPEAESLWAALRPVLADPALLPWLGGAPQTNEVGRAALLMSGLLVIADRFPQPLELLELGASAGLNLHLDNYGYDLGGLHAGDPASPLRLKPNWTGPPPPDRAVAIAGRRGVDLNPLDPRQDGERLLAYVWPDQQARIARLETALALAAGDPPLVDRGDAAEWLEARLAEPAAGGVTRVVLHSVAFHYFPAATQARITAMIAEAGATAAEESPLAWLRYETEPDEDRFTLRLRLWPSGEERLLASCDPHGNRVDWLAG